MPAVSAGQPLRQLFPMASNDVLDLFSKMFLYDPKARISAEEALAHGCFSSGPSPTEPALLPGPPKRQPLNLKVLYFNPQQDPTVLSPPRKSRRVMPHHLSFEGTAHLVDKGDFHADEIREAASGRTEHVPMSLDFSVFGSRPPSRPTINSADRSHLRRKLDPEFQLPEDE